VCWVADVQQSLEINRTVRFLNSSKIVLVHKFATTKWTVDDSVSVTAEHAQAGLTFNYRLLVFPFGDHLLDGGCRLTIRFQFLTNESRIITNLIQASLLVSNADGSSFVATSDQYHDFCNARSSALGWDKYKGYYSNVKTETISVLVQYSFAINTDYSKQDHGLTPVEVNDRQNRRKCTAFNAV
jgi:hypothetical protein